MELNSDHLNQYLAASSLLISYLTKGLCPQRHLFCGFNDRYHLSLLKLYNRKKAKQKYNYIPSLNC